MAVGDTPSRIARHSLTIPSGVETVAGQCVIVTARGTIPANSAVMVDTANADSVVICDTKATSQVKFIGFLVGKVGINGDVSVGTDVVTGDKCAVQVSGIANAIAEGTVTQGDEVVVSDTNGAVETDASPTFAEGVAGVCMLTAADGVATRVLIHKR